MTVAITGYSRADYNSQVVAFYRIASYFLCLKVNAAVDNRIIMPVFRSFWTTTQWRILSAQRSYADFAKALEGTVEDDF